MGVFSAGGYSSYMITLLFMSTRGRTRRPEFQAAARDFVLVRKDF